MQKAGNVYKLGMANQVGEGTRNCYTKIYYIL
jgi:hypothetical protein